MATKTSEVVAAVMEKVRRSAFAGLLNLFLAVPPAPASRPKVARFGGVYYGKTYEQFRSAAQAELAKARVELTEQPLVVLLEFRCEKPRTGKLELPKGDTDNYAKGPLDAMTKATRFWADDDQVALLVAAKRYAKPGEEPGVVIEWGPLANVI